MDSAEEVIEALSESERLLRAENARLRSEYDGLLRLYAQERDARALEQYAHAQTKAWLEAAQKSLVVEWD
ncbi:hypothetical protein [Xanthobacter agilis]|uniref:NAD(P)H-dependent FMN reductase n=1 Tax=Xanthobacter agilis TaxID=47492 RepID=A0ABU0LFN4_XANAG|nr:hypothetical protein [Xanthobacter agilis]MDQ0505959.1 NAD(P)H-dependent FMN reductase [Xanthobacter agilis]